MTFLTGSNPVLTRELRGSLRNVRAFFMLAIYVTLIGGVVVSAFPGDQQVNMVSDGGARALSLLSWIIGGQVALILVMLPAMATGALAQERERQTLEPLLLSPLTPLQIVWGKAGGVLSLVCLLLIATIPLTSLCFLLGGVDPGLLVLCYCGLLGLAFCTTGFGLYCAARWTGATRAMLACYIYLPMVMICVAIFTPGGAFLAGLIALALFGVGLSNWWTKCAGKRWAKRLGSCYEPGRYGLIGAFYLLLLGSMVRLPGTIGLIVVAVFFVLAYAVATTQWGMLQTAKELMQRNDPEAPFRQKVAEFKEEWQKALATAPAEGAYLPRQNLPASSTATSSWAPEQAATASPAAPESPSTESPSMASPMTASPATVQRPAPAVDAMAAAEARALAAIAESKKTYGKTPFLSDRLNPIYARELRSGLLGKFEYLFRFTYIATILTELGFLIFLLAGIYNADLLAKTSFPDIFTLWSRVHFGLLLILGAWFGARSIAPEREGQTLVQLFTIPMTPSKIIQGKMGAVLTFTMYLWVLGMPFVLLLTTLSLIPLAVGARFVLVEAVVGILASAWGIFCSFHGGTVRRALATSMGGALATLLVHSLVFPLWDIFKALKLTASYAGAHRIYSLLPVPLMGSASSAGDDALNFSYATSTPATIGWPATLTMLALYGILALVLLGLTARGFRRFAQTA